MIKVSMTSVMILTAIVRFQCFSHLVISSLSFTFASTKNSKSFMYRTFQSHHHEYEYLGQQNINKHTYLIPWSPVLSSVATPALITTKLKSTSSSDVDDVDKSNQLNHNTTTTVVQQSQHNDMKSKIIQAAAELTTSTSFLLNTKSIGVDYGLVRTGIAVSNGGYNPQPLYILSHLNNTQLCNRIVTIVESEKAHQVVMGIPYHKNGTEAEQTVITRNFASMLNCALCAHFGIDRIPIYLWDERYTSQEAESRIRAVNPRAGLLYKDLDADAASIILECYYNENGIGAEKVSLPDSEEFRNVVEKAWLKRREERLKEIDDLRNRRMNAGKKKQELIEKAKLLDATLGNTEGSNKKKGKKKKKKKKRTWVDMS